MLVTTDAIILRSMKFRETSRILTLYTREFGRVSVLAKGARDPKSRFGSSLELMNFVRAILYRKESRSIQLLSGCEVVRPFRSLAGDLSRMGAAIPILELMNLVAREEEKNPALFELLVSCLIAIDGATKGHRGALYFFEAQLLEVLGFRPDFDICGGCGRSLASAGGARISLRAAQGAVHCPECTGEGRGLETYSSGALGILRRLQSLRDPEGATRIAMDSAQEAEVGSVLRHLLQTHVEGIRTLKSEAVFASIL